MSPLLALAIVFFVGFSMGLAVAVLIYGDKR